MAFKVTKIVDCATIEITPKWRWLEEYGTTIKIQGYIAPAENNQYIIEKLTLLLLDKFVTLKNPVGALNGILNCSVFLNDVDVSKYFSELKSI
jgi:hypothetical protein